MKPSLLIVSLETKREAVLPEGWTKVEPTTVSDLSSAMKTLKKRRFDIGWIPVPLSKKADFHLLKQIRKMDGSLEWLVVLEPAQVPLAIEMWGGQWDYLVTPYSREELKWKLEKILAKRNLERENRFWRVELAALLADRGTLTMEDIPADIWEKAGEGKAKDEPQPFKRSRKEFERECLRRALERAQGSQTQAAKALGIHRNTLIWKLKKLNLENECKKIVRKRRGQ